MTSVSNGIGATTSVAYDRLNKNAPFYTKGSGATYPTQDLDNSMYVVSEVDASNGLGTCAPPATTNCYTTKYAYAGAKMDLRGRGFLGFTSITATDQQTGVVQTTTYRTDFPYTGAVAAQTSVTGFTRNGCVAGTMLKSVTNTYTAPTPTAPATPLFVALHQSVVAGNDCEGSPLPTTTTTYTYDSYGNATQVSASVSGGSSSVKASREKMRYNPHMTLARKYVSWLGGHVRIPDGLNLLKGTISEIKNTGYQSLTAQIRSFMQHAFDKGFRFDLYTRPGRVFQAHYKMR